MHNALFKLAFFLLFFIEGYSLVQSQNKKMSVTDFGAAPFDLTGRVFRGGSWGNAGWCSKHNFRGAGKPDKGDDRVGLRLVMDAE
jgi:formylglycine-generating enzyme required for sulfatase activity